MSEIVRAWFSHPIMLAKTDGSGYTQNYSDFDKMSAGSWWSDTTATVDGHTLTLRKPGYLDVTVPFKSYWTKNTIPTQAAPVGKSGAVAPKAAK